MVENLVVVDAEATAQRCGRPGVRWPLLDALVQRADLGERLLAARQAHGCDHRFGVQTGHGAVVTLPRWSLNLANGTGSGVRVRCVRGRPRRVPAEAGPQPDPGARRRRRPTATRK